jgi:hypothetical protein
MRLRGGGSPERESLKDRERGEREREPERERERERERDLIRSQCPAGAGPGDVSTPITCLRTHHEVAQHNTNMDNGMPT